MFCNSCGSKLNKGDRVCNACGAPADQGETCGGFWGIVSAPVPAPAPAPGGIKQPAAGIKQPVGAPVIKEQPRHTAPAPAPAPAPVHTPAPVPVAAPAPKVPQLLIYGVAALLLLLLLGQLVWTGILHARLNRLADEVERLREEVRQVEVTETRKEILPAATTPETTVPETTVPASSGVEEDEEAVKSEENQPGKPEGTEEGAQTSGETQSSDESTPSDDTQPAEKPQEDPAAEENP